MTQIEVTITYLEMEHPAMLRAKRSARAGLSLERVDPPSAELAANFYCNIGNEYFWMDRAEWSEEQWEEALARPGTELWVLKVEGDDAGFFLLTQPAPRTREIEYFGLYSWYAGQGLGAHLLTCAIERAWEAGADRVLVNTCTLDHPQALPNYQARGFEIVRKRTEWRMLPE
ncbi:MAG: GNAT family N-acetyltransferase [Gemmatimonadetes bacterium]|nr:GNAT family N-acetyltransferase [Gemmatimonadota bacterium]